MTKYLFPWIYWDVGGKTLVTTITSPTSVINIFVAHADQVSSNGLCPSPSTHVVWIGPLIHLMRWTLGAKILNRCPNGRMDRSRRFKVRFHQENHVTTSSPSMQFKARFKRYPHSQSLVENVKLYFFYLKFLIFFDFSRFFLIVLSRFFPIRNA